MAAIGHPTTPGAEELLKISLSVHRMNQRRNIGAEQSCLMDETYCSDEFGDSLPKKTPRLTIPELTAALSHPTRNYALAILTERISSPKELAKELNRTIR